MCTCHDGSCPFSFHVGPLCVRVVVCTILVRDMVDSFCVRVTVHPISDGRYYFACVVVGLSLYVLWWFYLYTC